MIERLSKLNANKVSLDYLVTVYDEEIEIIKRAVTSVQKSIQMANLNFENIDIGIIIIINKKRSDIEISVNKNYVRQIINFNELPIARLRNQAVLKSNAKYISFLDADDITHPTFLHQFIRNIDNVEKKNSLRVYHPEIVIYFKKNDVCKIIYQVGMGKYSLRKFRILNENLWISHMIVGRHVMLKYNFTEEHPIFWEDWAWNIKSIQNKIEHIVLPRTMCLVEKRDKSLSTRNVSMNLRIPSGLTKLGALQNLKNSLFNEIFYIFCRTFGQVKSHRLEKELYLDMYADVKKSNLQPKKHFAQYGFLEGRISRRDQLKKIPEELELMAYSINCGVVVDTRFRR